MMKKDSAFTCPNPSCGKVFAKPLEAVNLQSRTPQPYKACPYCLTEIPAEEKPTVVADELKKKETKTHGKKTKPRLMEEKPAETPESPPGCHHHFGYLGERSSKEKIPDECIMCKDIVQCMLKNVTG